MKKYQAVNYTQGRIKKIRLIVIHTTQGQELKNQAATVAAWFSDPARSPKSSAHVIVDNKNIITIVRDTDTAWAAPNANADGLHLELVGRADQGDKGWADPYSQAVLKNAAIVCADWIKTHDIAPRRLNKNQILDRKSSGVCGHADISKAFNTPGGHSDPGPDFPYNDFLALIKTNLID